MVFAGVLEEFLRLGSNDVLPLENRSKMVRMHKIDAAEVQLKVACGF